MAMIQPPSWMQGACYSAEDERATLGGLFLRPGVAGDDSFKPSLNVGSETITVSPGSLYVPELSGSGVFHVQITGLPHTVPLPSSSGSGARSLTLWVSIPLNETGPSLDWSFIFRDTSAGPSPSSHSFPIARFDFTLVGGVKTDLTMVDARETMQLNTGSSGGSLLGAASRYWRRSWAPWYGSGTFPALEFDEEFDFASIFPDAPAKFVMLDVATEGGAGGAVTGGAGVVGVGGGGGSGTRALVRVFLDPANPRLRLFGVGGPSGGLGIQRPDWPTYQFIYNGEDGHVFSQNVSSGPVNGYAPPAYAGGFGPPPVPGGVTALPQYGNSPGRSGRVFHGLGNISSDTALALSRSGDGGGPGGGEGSSFFQLPTLESLSGGWSGGSGGAGGLKASPTQGDPVQMRGGHGSQGQVVIHVYG